jgi:hypothetical protein
VAKKRNQTRRHWRGAIRFVNSPVVASFDEIISEAASAFAFQVIEDARSNCERAGEIFLRAAYGH